ncbi:hypothetical protein L2E82_24860 [Cichorium intybus]|uniref:Uncharacterized protein n=1 Tax=Cichorium intybus TaxID=13427 RepID=A0ACB9E2N0_CICIN|nr:hypothetical protein L2E82_24860 [Cichorium intybus]
MSSSFSSTSNNKIPPFDANNFGMCKSKALMVLETMDYHMLDILKNGTYIPHFTITKDGVPGENKATPSHEFTEEDKRLINLDARARAAIGNSLPYEIYHLVQNCLTAKEMLSTLTVSFEVTAEVLAAQENILNRKYEHFFAYKNETITQTFNCFNCLVNDMRRFNIVKLDSVLVLKFLDSLDVKWEHHVDVLKNSEKIHSQHERSTALFSKNQEKADTKDATDEDLDAEDEEFKHMADLASQAAMIVKQFSQYKDNRRNGAPPSSGGSKPNFSSLRKSISDSTKSTGEKRNVGKCFNCGSTEHFAKDLLIAEEEKEKWEEEADSSDDENQNMCLMAVTDGPTEESRSSTSSTSTDAGMAKDCDSSMYQATKILGGYFENAVKIFKKVEIEPVFPSKEELIEDFKNKFVPSGFQKETELIEKHCSINKEGNIDIQTKISAIDHSLKGIEQENVGGQENIWYLDSGCSRHMTGYKSLLEDFVKKNGPVVTYGDNSHGQTKGYGTIRCKSVQFSNVSYVKGLKHNLISISQLCDADYDACFNKKEGNIINAAKEVVLSAKSCDNICILDMFSADQSLESLMHMDLFGPVPVASLAGKKYYLVIVDEFPRFTWVMFLRNKSDAATEIINLIKQSEVLFDLKVKQLRSDHGTEFRNQTLEDFCKEKGILQNFSAVRTPEQNGVAERRNQTLIEAGRTMVVDVGLPLSFWAEAVNTTCYTQNRSIIVKRHGKIKYEVLKGRSPDISYFHAFGCASFRIFNVNKRKVIESINVRFDESTFPHQHEVYEHSVLENLLCPISSAPLDQILVPSAIPSSDDRSSPSHEPHSPDDQTLGSSSSPEATPVDADPPFNVESEETLHSQSLPAVKDHPISQVIGDVTSGVRTRRQVSSNFCLYVNFVSLIEPKKVDDALRDADWIKAMQDELHEFERHKVWTLVPPPQGKTIIGTRLVAQGFTQMEGLDYDETFAPVARLEAIRLFLAFASFMKFKVFQMDVKTAFFHGDLPQEVYLKQPPGFCNDSFPNHVYRLDKAVYGLKQAPRAWYDTLASYLLGKGYHRGAIDNTLFIKRSGDDIILAQFYVDDIIFGSTNDKLSDEFATVMSSKFEMSMMAKTPMSTSVYLSADPSGVDVNASFDRGMIGSLLYLTASRPDIVFATSMCAQFQAMPKESHLNAVKRIFRYLKHTPNLGLWYPSESSFDLVGFTDSGFAGCALDCKSTSGGCQLLGNRLISWSSKKQSSVACSTAEAEYVAAGRCCAPVLWIQNQLMDYGFNLSKTPICCDNTSAILISQNLVQHSKTKHIDVRHNFIRDIIQKEKIELLYIPTEQQLADIFTKPLDEQKMLFFIGELGMISQ